MKIAPTQYQGQVLAVPETFNLFLGGGRGGGKSYGAMLLVLRHVEQYKDRARPLIVRETYKAASELAETLHMLLVAAYGRRAVRYNKADNVFRLANGAVIEVGQLDGPTAYSKYQGRSFTLLVVDEIGLLPNLRYVKMLRSNLRAAEGVPLREVRTANPGGTQHATLAREHVNRAPPWAPYATEDGETWVNAPSTYVDNPHLDGDAYHRRLRAATAGDTELLRAWVEGDWNIARGAMFGDVWDPEVHVLPADFRPPFRLRGHRTALGVDWGSSAPAVALIGVETSGEDGLFPKGSLIVLDEIHTADPADLSQGLRWPPGKLCDSIRERCAHWNIRPHGVGDDAAGLDESLLAVFRREGVYLTPPRKGPGSRIAGWQRLRQRMLHAVERDGPGLYVTGRCGLLLETLPTLPRDPNRPEDVDTGANDHAADALRYLEGFISTSRRYGSGRVEGHFG
ncbi:Terminase-like family protein [Lutimaribacter pacificus]|uniref:Terminase-like family protein n=1 Tax=Lutimaribacter pacificus TaxID=391948 RepID=A0A1H0F7T9_9RHOB|nr:phage terminase large subunit [Lutimaribacter pacificus]SDN90704.1 Terminase-like family protein [Lutimaribacter pacificus]SHK45965.1 Terminase-like family protein [Lutimaribacter pacificus]